jgi:hypothetical protein
MDRLGGLGKTDLAAAAEDWRTVFMSLIRTSHEIRSQRLAEK